MCERCDSAVEMNPNGVTKVVITDEQGMNQTMLINGAYVVVGLYKTDESVTYKVAMAGTTPGLQHCLGEVVLSMTESRERGLVEAVSIPENMTDITIAALKLQMLREIQGKEMQPQHHQQRALPAELFDLDRRTRHA